MQVIVCTRIFGVFKQNRHEYACIKLKKYKNTGKMFIWEYDNYNNWKIWKHS